MELRTVELHRGTASWPNVDAVAGRGTALDVNIVASHGNAWGRKGVRGTATGRENRTVDIAPGVEIL